MTFLLLRMLKGRSSRTFISLVRHASLFPGKRMGSRPVPAPWMFLVMVVSLGGRSEGQRGTEYPLVPWEDMWQEVEEMTAGMEHCLPERSLCWPPGSTTNDDGICSQCACDKECVHYGDCCRDMAQAEWGDGREEGSGRYICGRLKPTGIVGLLMVDSCLPEYSSTPVERLCTQQVPPEAYNYILDIAVTSRVTNTTYANYHCAVCNNDASLLRIWSVTINCQSREIPKKFTMQDFMQKAKYFPGRLFLRRSVYKNEEDERRNIHQEVFHCFIEVADFSEPSQFVEQYGGRLCLYPKSACQASSRGGAQHCREQVRHCHPAWPDHLDVEKCRRYSQLMHYRTPDRKTILYKNPHCARCNFVNVSSSDFKCLNPSDSSLCTPGMRKGFLSPVFSVLFDFKNSTCGARDELWDPIHLSCKKIYCGRLYKLSNGECIRDSAVFAALKNSTLLDDSCRKILLSEHEFIPLSDGSVLVNATNKVYEQGKYELLNEEKILICNEHEPYVAHFTKIHELLTFIVIVISLVGLGLHITIYLLVPRLRNLPGKNLLSLSCCLFVAYMIFLTGIKATEHHGVCVFISATLHFFWIASFCWMNVMSVDVCRTFTGRLHRGNYSGKWTYTFYSIYAWGVPIVIVALSLVFDYVDILPDYQPDYATDLCWINNRYGLVLFFLLPVGAIVLENTVLFIVTAFGIYKQVKEARYANTRSQSIRATKKEKAVKSLKKGGHVQAPQSQGSKERLRLVLYMKLGVIQGLAWMTGFIAAFADIPACWYPFTIFNGLQGAFIFLAFDMKRKVWETVWQAVSGQPWRKRKSSKETRTTTSGRTSSGHNQSSKSDSDSNEESQLYRGVGELVGLEDGVGWKAREGVTWNSSAKYSALSHTPERVSSQQGRQLRPLASQGTSSDSPPSHPQPVQEPESHSNRLVDVRKGDLRARVVRGNFDGEGREEAFKKLKFEDEKEGCGGRQALQDQTERRKNRPDLQRVMDLLQHLQQSRSYVDLPDLVQQLLKNSARPTEQGKRKLATISKCRSFTEGICPELQEEEQRVLAAKLKTMMTGFTTPRQDSSHPESVCLPRTHSTAHQPNRPLSQANTANTSHNSLYSPAKYYLSPLVTDDEEMTNSQQPTNIPQETVRPMQRICKSHSFSQISKVALAISALQQAALDARDRRCQDSDSTKIGAKENGEKSPTTHGKKQTPVPESLV